MPKRKPCPLCGTMLAKMEALEAKTYSGAIRVEHLGRDLAMALAGASAFYTKRARAQAEKSLKAWREAHQTQDEKGDR